MVNYADVLIVALGNLLLDAVGERKLIVDHGILISRVACKMNVPQRIDINPDNSEQICTVVCGSCNKQSQLWEKVAIVFLFHMVLLDMEIWNRLKYELTLNITNDAMIVHEVNMA